MASGHQPGNIIVNYKECRRNYAASFGSHAVDGCREFIAAGEQGTEEEFLCEACGCHRSFHRKEVIRDGVVHTAPLPAGPPFFPPPAAAVAMVPMVPYMVLHQPVDYHNNSLTAPAQSASSGVSQPDFDEDDSEYKPNVHKRAKMERF